MFWRNSWGQRVGDSSEICIYQFGESCIKHWRNTSKSYSCQENLSTKKTQGATTRQENFKKIKKTQCTQLMELCRSVSMSSNVLAFARRATELLYTDLSHQVLAKWLSARQTLPPRMQELSRAKITRWVIVALFSSFYNCLWLFSRRQNWPEISLEQCCRKSLSL